jgi:hypothetical protein
LISREIYFSVPYSSISDNLEVPAEMTAGINILIDSLEVDVQVILNFMTSVNNHFIFSLQGSILHNHEINGFLPSFYLLYTLSGSFGTPNIIPVFISEPHEPLSNLHIIKDYLRLQGEQNIDFMLIDPAVVKIEAPVFFTNIGSLKNFNEVKLEQICNQNIKQIILSPAPLSQQAASIKLLTNENKHVDLLLQIIALKNKECYNRRESELWEKRAGLYLSFITLGKQVGEKEYYDIKEWYHKEYEVLPLWYKRIGHIIKFLTGKRSFKSLFSDKEK